MPYSDTEANHNPQANVLCKILLPTTSVFFFFFFISLFSFPRNAPFIVHFNRQIPFWDGHDNAHTP